MDRQTIEAAERVTAWSRARALAAVLAAPAMTASAESADGQHEGPLEERYQAALRYLGEQAPAAEDQQ